MAFNFNVRAESIDEVHGLATARLATALVEQPELAPQSAALSAVLAAYLALASEPAPGRAIIVAVHGSVWFEADNVLGGIGGGINISYGHVENEAAETDATPLAIGGRGALPTDPVS